MGSTLDGSVNGFIKVLFETRLLGPFEGLVCVNLFYLHRLRRCEFIREIYTMENIELLQKMKYNKLSLFFLFKNLFYLD